MKSYLARPPENVRIEQVNALFKQSPFLFLGLLSAILIIVFYFWDSSISHRGLLFWLFANLSLLGLRVIMIRRFHRIKPKKTAVKWGYLFSFSAMLSGMLWGSFPVFLLDTGDLSGVFLFTTILTGTVAGSLVPMSVFIPAHQMYTIFSLVPLIYVSLNDGQPVLTSIGIILIIYLGVMLVFSLISNANVRESIQLRFENLDLLEEFRHQKQLADRANLDKSRFLAATSHDLRQPLHALDLYLGALKGLLTTDEQRELLNRAISSSHSLGELLNALLDISRLDAQQVDINRTTFALHELLSDLVSEFQPLAHNRGLRIRLQDCAFFVKSDPVLLARIIRNFLSNAVKYSDTGEIVIFCEPEAESVRINVSDQGRGISLAEQENIFSEFYQLENPERDRSKGLGLGLASVRRMADLLDHPVEVQSEPGKGSCFSVRIPVSEYIDQHSDGVDMPVSASVEGMFIICVDDEKEVRDALRALLRGWDCEVLMADSEQGVLDELAASDYPQPDAIISDYRLRDNRSGIEVIAAINRFFDTQIPAIIMTGDTGPEIRQQAQTVKARLMFKPVSPENLLTALASMNRG
ncbi:MAG TPA: hybrid sensor histidine kinase/response regulator [Gammaproteobacteria bacterium]|nr:hybrid sensor histidine kinase/response regulator [Gammaproteobacteria bacterium]